MNTLISETDTIFELRQGPFISFGQWKALYVLIYIKIFGVFWDLVWSGGTSLHLVDSEAVCLLTNSHVLWDLAGEDLLSSDGGHHVLLKSGVRLHRAGYD